METIVDRLTAHAASYPGRVAFTFLGDGVDERLTYAALDHASRRIAAALAHLEIGARVLLLVPHGPAFVEALFGCFRAGVCAVPCVAASAGTRPAVVLTTTKMAPSRALVPGIAGVPAIAIDALPAGNAPKRAAGADDAVMLAGGPVTHAEIASAVRPISDANVVGCLPLHDELGMSSGVLQPVYAGARSTILSPLAVLAQPMRWLAEITRRGATAGGAPSVVYAACIATADRHGVDPTLDLSAWSHAVVGEPVRARLLDIFAETFAPCGFRRDAFRAWQLATRLAVPAA